MVPGVDLVGPGELVPRLAGELKPVIWAVVVVAGDASRSVSAAGTMGALFRRGAMVRGSRLQRERDAIQCDRTASSGHALGSRSDITIVHVV